MATIEQGMQQGPRAAREEVAAGPNGRPNGRTGRIVATRPHRRLTQAELDGFLEKAADLLRGGVDHSEFRGYVFALLFYKRINDVYLENIAALEKELGDALPDSDGSYLLSYYDVSTAFDASAGGYGGAGHSGGAGESADRSHWQHSCISCTSLNTKIYAHKLSRKSGPRRQWFSRRVSSIGKQNCMRRIFLLI
jgi:hypothetical protein